MSVANVAPLFAEHLDRVGWGGPRLRDARRQGLRRLVGIARQRSRWYRDRLAGIDADLVTERQLPRIHPMTKDDLMEHFDDIVTDPRMSRRLAESHLATREPTDPVLGHYRIFASGGSSGRRGVFVYDWASLLTCGLVSVRWSVRDELRTGGIVPGIRAVIVSPDPWHLSAAVGSLFRSPDGESRIFSATMPRDALVAQLNRAGPAALVGYPSVIYALANEARAGRLTIAPRRVVTNSEPLLPEMREAFETVWGSRVGNVYGTSEGASAASCGEGVGLHLNEDVCIFELINADGEPARPGQRAVRLYITNLYNLVQPLIRYEIDDEVTLLDGPCPCGSHMRRIADVQGRVDEAFVYATGLVVHPMVFRSVLGKQPNVAEYQVRQTPMGASIAIRTEGPADAVALQGLIAAALTQAGLHDPAVKIVPVEGIERSRAGKLKRFIPLRP